MIEEIVNDIFPKGLSFEAGIELIWPVTLYVLGIVAYAVFIFKFYRFIASRDMFEFDLSKYEHSRHLWIRRFLHVVMYALKYMGVFPAFAFFWFAVLTFILAFLSKEQDISQILVIALAMVGVIRVTAYYNQDLSRDVAKILPFAVLGLFLVDASFFEITQSLDVLSDADNYRESILYYLLFIVLLEFALRLILGAKALFIRWRDGPPTTDDESPDAPLPSVEWQDWEEDMQNSQPSSEPESKAGTASAEGDEEEEESEEKSGGSTPPQTS